MNRKIPTIIDLIPTDSCLTLCRRFVIHQIVWLFGSRAGVIPLIEDSEAHAHWRNWQSVSRTQIDEHSSGARELVQALDAKAGLCLVMALAPKDRSER